MAVEWKKSMSTGLAEIDEEHKEWLRRFNEFDKELVSENRADHMYVALRFFEIYTDFHFGHEEACVLNKQSPEAKQNRREHGLIKNLIKDLKQRIKQEGAGLVEVMELKLEMDRWLVDHISKTDIQLFKADRKDLQLS
ncbi:bacteriohemerythrin [Chloroflexota bacterium]